jgi:hypothetical protein
VRMEITVFRLTSESTGPLVDSLLHPGVETGGVIPRCCDRIIYKLTSI